jgi:hypothetical protein
MWKEGDQVCAAMERAITQQPADRRGIYVVGASDISLRLPAAAMTEPLRGLRRGEHVADRGLLLMCLALLLLAAWNVWQILQYNVPA